MFSLGSPGPNSKAKVGPSGQELFVDLLHGILETTEQTGEGPLRCLMWQAVLSGRMGGVCVPDTLVIMPRSDFPHILEIIFRCFVQSFGGKLIVRKPPSKQQSVTDS